MAEEIHWLVPLKVGSTGFSGRFARYGFQWVRAVLALLHAIIAVAPGTVKADVAMPVAGVCMSEATFAEKSFVKTWSRVRHLDVRCVTALRVSPC